MSEEKKTPKHEVRLIHAAYIRDGATLHTGESVLLACLLHAKGAGRKSKDMEDVQKIMRDHNLEQPHAKKD
jgi:hypothetical protein